MRVPWKGDGRVTQVTADDGNRLERAPWKGDGRMSASSHSGTSIINLQRQLVEQSPHVAQHAKAAKAGGSTTHKCAMQPENPDTG